MSNKSHRPTEDLMCDLSGNLEAIQVGITDLTVLINRIVDKGDPSTGRVLKILAAMGSHTFDAKELVKNLQDRKAWEDRAFSPEEKVLAVLKSKMGWDAKNIPHLVIGDWDCPGTTEGKAVANPLRVCVYNLDTDPAMDQCLFCGDPDERK